ncbi:MAG: YafY family transcriptional regulator [Anaerolineae bacterium]|nr:YafY family transcriptional regulator [Chloroflexota bacterium]MBP6298083.1 YafY family transcriptional regulator [Anaerolineae bacterium]
MYSPTLRLLTILELLQSHPSMSGSQLARRLEVEVRTVRRYIVMLQDMGIPIEAERGPEGAYHLQRGFKLPPLMFNDAEAVALTLGLLMLRAFQLPGEMAAIEGALAKTERVMPEKLLEQVRGLQEAITFSVSSAPTQFQPRFVSLLSIALQQHKRVFLRYLAFGGDTSARPFDPYGIVCHEGYWYTSGYCHLRNELRTFRIDRIVTLDLLDQSFDRPADFDAVKHILGSLATMPGMYAIEIVLQGTMEEVRRVLSPQAGTFEETEVGIIWRREAHELNWIAQVLLQFDFPVTIRKPAELCEKMLDLAARAVRMTVKS